MRQRATQVQLVCTITLILTTTIYYVLAHVENVWGVAISFGDVSTSAFDSDLYGQLVTDRITILLAMLSINVSMDSM